MRPTDNEVEIRRWFKDHIVEKCDQWTVFRKPGTSICLVRYQVWHNILIVTGDLGDAIYQWSSDISLEWVGGCHLDYFEEKCQASEYGREFRSWDSEKATKRLKEWWEDEDTRTQEQQELYAEALQSVDSEFEWHIFVHENGHELFGDEYYEYGEIGKKIDIRCESHLIGLKMMLEQKAEEET